MERGDRVHEDRLTVARRLADMAGVFADMAEAADKAKTKAAQDATKVVKDAVDATGGRYRIKKIRLGARSDVKSFATSGGGNVARGRVQATPRAFWTWVEEGTHPHIIVGRSSRGKRTSRKKRSSVALGRKANKAFGGKNVDSIGNPLAIPGIGYREYAHHPGARSQGHPWEEAMGVSARLVPAAVAKSSTLALAKAFT